MNSPINQALVFLINTLFDIYTMIVMLRLLFQLVRADFYNPLSQFIVKITNPLLKPLRRVIPGYAGIDFASVFLLLLLVWIKLTALLFIQIGIVPDILGLLVWSLGDLLTLLLDVYFYAILIQILLSWVMPSGQYNPIISALYSLTNPVLSRARRIIPPISGFDISPIPVMILLKLLVILLANPVVQYGTFLATR